MRETRLERSWRIELLGGLRVEGGGRVVTRFPTQKAAALLAYLAYHRDRPHPREVLAALLWPEAEWEAARHRLNVALSSLRQQ
jgi:DNA-binding SARP family transcriptional activator